jgi:3-isopropylmalate/(R)-2-methylmalate dehydratase small subunit
VIASSFADIFFNNCFKNGILPIVLDEDAVDQLFNECFASEGYSLDINLAEQTVTTPSGQSFSFEVDAFRKHCLINGLDDIGLTLQESEAIRSYESARKQDAPWLF